MKKSSVYFSVITFLLSAAVLVSGKSYGQEETESRQIKTIVGKVLKIDVDGGVLNVETGTVQKQDFSDAHLDADLLWGELVKNGYIDPNGTIQPPFYGLNKFSNMLLSKKFSARKKLIYDIFQKILKDNGGLLAFYISNDSELLQGTHHITSVEISQNDPVTVQYDSSSPDKNNIIRLVDYNSAD